MSATTEQYNGNLQPLLVWALNPPENSGQNRKDHPPEPYRSWIEGHFPEDRQYIKYWTGKITPTSKLTEDGEWVDRYPHIHTESVGWDPSTVTMLFYLVAPESGGEIGVGGYDENDPYTFITVTPGLVVLMDATLWHGVKPVISGERVALVVSGFPRNGYSEEQAAANMLRKIPR